MIQIPLYVACYIRIAAHGSGRGNLELAVLPTFGLDSTTRPDSWRQWFDAAGISDDVSTPHSAGFELQSMVVRAAEAGLGIALVPEFFIPDAAWKNGLVRAHELSISAQDSYHLVYPNDLRDSDSLQCFKAWILDEAKEFAREHDLPC